MHNLISRCFIVTPCKFLLVVINVTYTSRVKINKYRANGYPWRVPLPRVK